MDIPLDVRERRKILLEMLKFSSFGADNQQENLSWLIEDINQIIRLLGLHGAVKLLDLSHSETQISR